MPAEPSALTEALASVQAHLPKIEKGETATVQTKQGGSYKYSYADLAAVSRAVLPLLGEHGLAWVTRPTLNEGKFVLIYELRHTSGESITGEYPLTGGTPQEIGSAITYARRYALCSVTGVAPASDDDDAQAASNRTRYEPEPARQEPAEPQPTDEQTEAFGRFRLEIKGSTVIGLAALVHEIKAAAEEGRITPRQNRRLAELWKERNAELEAEPAAGSAPEREQSDATN